MTEDMNEVASVETNMPPNTVDQFTKLTMTLKRRREESEEVPPKKICNGLIICKEVAEDARPPSTLEDSTLLLPIEVCTSIQTKKELDENKENSPATVHENPNFDSILAKTLLAAREKGKVSEGEAPKVIVEHQPLPSIYELGQVTRDLDNTLLRSDEEDSGDSDEDSSMFEIPPNQSTPAPHPQRTYWSGSFTTQITPVTSSTPTTLPSPAPSPVPTVLTQVQPPHTQPSATYQFLDQSNQRIECDENGKSYLQLGTVNHHIPVTPVLQPKPTTLAPRQPRPLPSQMFRPGQVHGIHPARPPNPTPPCDHSSCLSRRNSPCYRGQRSRMLNMSLHKLHMARQRADSNLCRSVLICNMLRYIEEESEQEQREQEATFASQQESPYWNNLNNQNLNSFAPPTPAHPYRENSYSQAGSTDGFEAPLKDFNSAFRQTPVPLLPTPVEPTEVGSEEERGINWSSVLSLSSQSDLDPINNNSFAESWSPSSQELTDVDLSQHSFDDINWKLTPVSADDVLKAFPNDENLFQCSA